MLITHVLVLDVLVVSGVAVRQALLEVVRLEKREQEQINHLAGVVVQQKVGLHTHVKGCASA